jgi:serine/threonine-protein kinase HipA
VTYQSVDLLEVWAWGQRVGAVARNPEGALSVFQYTPEWIEGGIALSPLTMPLRQTPYDVSQWDIDPEPFKYLPPPLADSLPDAFGNALVDEWMSRQGIDQQRITPLDRLAYAADRAIGALEFRPPARVTRTETTAVQLADLVTAARRTVRGVLADDASAHAALDMLIQVGTSAGGAPIRFTLLLPSSKRATSTGSSNLTASAQPVWTATATHWARVRPTAVSSTPTT